MNTGDDRHTRSCCGLACEIFDIVATVKYCVHVSSVLCSVLPIVFLLAGCSEKGGILKTGQLAPSFALTDVSGKVIKVPEDVKGKVTAIRFWATSCRFCAAEMPEIERMYRKYAEKGLVILAVNIGEDRSNVENFAKGYNLSYPVLLDPGQKVTKRYGVISIPVTYVLDRNGVIRQKILGEISSQTFEKIIVEDLNRRNA